MPLRSKREGPVELHDQSQRLSRTDLIKVFGVLGLALMFCHVDQTGIGVLLPSIARDLKAQSSITWAGTSSLIANAVFQVLYGRLSDLFGRRNILLSALLFLSMSDLACSLSINATMLYAFRGLAGVANGGITSLAMIIVADFVEPRERGKYQGFNGLLVGMGSGFGPLLAAGLDLHGDWRGLYYLLAPALMVIAIFSWKFVPSNMPKEMNVKDTILKFDFLGLFFGAAGIILLLIPISNAGRNGTPWNSVSVIAMLVSSSISLVVFVLVEWKWATLPIMPVKMFHNPAVAAMLGQNVLSGAIFYSYTYFLPLYFQNVRGKSPIMSAILQLPLVVAQCTCSIGSGFYGSKNGRLGEVIWLGFGLWTLGAGLLILADDTLPFGAIAVVLSLIGCGIGMTFQPILVALQAQCDRAERAVVTTNRNLFRCCGGAIGIAVSSAILSRAIQVALPGHLQHVAKSTFAKPSLASFSEQDRAAVQHAYQSASRAVFIWLVPLSAVSMVLCILIKDGNIERKGKEESVTSATDVPSSGEGEGQRPESQASVADSSRESQTPRWSGSMTDSLDGFSSQREKSPRTAIHAV